jgi:hypothetical protein
MSEPDIRNLPFFNPDATAYWFVGDDETQVFSNKQRKMLPVSDPDFVKWRDGGGMIQRTTQEEVDKVVKGSERK